MSVEFTVGAVIPDGELPAISRGGRGRGPSEQTQAAIDVIEAVGDIQPDNWVVVAVVGVEDNEPAMVKHLRNITVTLRKRFPAWRFQQRKTANEEGAVTSIALIASRKADEAPAETAEVAEAV